MKQMLARQVELEKASQPQKANAAFGKCCA
jgi:hypothetical protein